MLFGSAVEHKQPPAVIVKGFGSRRRLLLQQHTQWHQTCVTSPCVLRYFVRWHAVQPQLMYVLAVHRLGNHH